MTRPTIVRANAGPSWSSTGAMTRLRARKTKVEHRTMTDGHHRDERARDTAHRGDDVYRHGSAPPESRADASDGKRPSVLASTGSMAIATLISRVTGFFKILLTAAVLGPAMSSAFISANTLPRTISE